MKVAGVSRAGGTLRVGSDRNWINGSRIDYAPAKPLPSAAEQRAAHLAIGHVVIVFGGRDYDDRDRVFAALDRVHERQAITLLVHGARHGPQDWQAARHG